MIYTSVPQIYEAIDETRKRLYQTVEGLSEEQAHTRPDPNSWSATDIIEHLTIMEERLLRMMMVMLTKAEAASTPANGATVEMEAFSLDKFIERSRNEKYVAPEAVRPNRTETIAALLMRMRQSRAGLHALRPRIEATNLASVTYPHPAFGPLNFYQWLALIGLHEERHLRQIQSVLSA